MSLSTKTSLKASIIQCLKIWINRIVPIFISGKARNLLGGFFFLLTIIVIGRVLYTNWATFREHSWEIRPIWFLYTAVFFFLDLLLATWVWHLFISRLTGFNNFRKNAKICWSANLARRIPGPIWYIAGRAILYEQEGIRKTTTTLLSALELAFFLVSGILTTLLILPFWIFQDSEVYKPIQFWIFLAILPLGIALVHPRVLERLWQKVSREKLTHHLLWRNTITWLWIYVLTWIIGAFVLFSVINIIYPLPLSELISTIGIWAFAGSISLAGALTISVVGLREVSLTLLLIQIIPSPIALIVAIGIRLVWLAGELLSALIAIKL